jgi:geranylgeranyl diphosphate synthase type II
MTAVADPPGSPWSADEVSAHLLDVGRDIRRHMLDALPQNPPHAWLYRVAREYPSRPGKAIRPALCLAACEAVGGDPARAHPVAVTIELFHNAFLAHDDIVDGSEQRRGRPTLPQLFGAGLALNAGDALAVVANQELRRRVARLPSAIAEQVLVEFDTMALRTLEGQATELGWREDDVVETTPDDYLDLILRKTCWYTTILPLRVGALIGSDGRADLRALFRFGFHLGAAFQIRDDVLNLVGDEREYGKEINGDLWEGKRTLAMIHLCEQAQGRDAVLVRDHLRRSREERTEEMVVAVRGLMDDYGSIDYAQAFADGIAEAASSTFAEAFGACPDGPALRFLAALIPYMVDRRR